MRDGEWREVSKVRQQLCLLRCYRRITALFLYLPLKVAGEADLTIQGALSMSPYSPSSPHTYSGWAAINFIAGWASPAVLDCISQALL